MNRSQQNRSRRTRVVELDECPQCGESYVEAQGMEGFCSARCYQDATAEMASWIDQNMRTEEEVEAQSAKFVDFGWSLPSSQGE